MQIASGRLLRNTKGVRFICGDWSQQPGVFRIPSEWEACGWREVHAMYGIPPKNIKDYLYLSPELVQFFDHAGVLEDIFADHAVLVARFHPFGFQEHVYNWRTPKWEEVGILETRTWNLYDTSSTTQMMLDICMPCRRVNPLPSKPARCRPTMHL